MLFTYKARTKEGKMETGTIEAYSKDAAVVLLQKYSIFVTSLEEKKKTIYFFQGMHFGKRVSKKELVVFFRQLSVMLSSSVPVVQSLRTLSSQTQNAYFKEVIARISTLVEEGASLSQAFSTYPKIFNNLHMNLVKSGEVSSHIAKTLEYISESIEREEDIMSQVKQAMIYPIFVGCLLILVLFIIAVEVMPQVRNLLEETGGKPSISTQIVLGFYGFLENYWYILIIALLLIILGLAFYFTTDSGKKNYDIISLKVPFLRSLLKKVFLARFCSNVSNLLVSGISINRALKITEDTIDNTVYKKVIAKIEKGVSEGQKMSSVMLKDQEYFPLFVVQMIKVGEETGKLDSTLIEIVNFYQKDIKKAIDVFSRLLEPLMIIILGVIVTLLAISVLSSIYGTIKTI